MNSDRDHSEDEAARILGISASTLRRMRRAGLVPHLKLGARIRYAADQVFEIKRSLRVEATTGPLAGRS